MESNESFTIGNSPIDNNIQASLNFHQYEIFNNQWPSSGTVKYDAVEKKFYILPDTP